MAVTQKQRQEALRQNDQINRSEIHVADQAEKIIDEWMLRNFGNEMPADFLQGCICRSGEPHRWPMILAELQRRYSDWEIIALNIRGGDNNGFPRTLVFKPKK